MIHGGLDSTGNRVKPWIPCDSRLFLWASAAKGHPMKHSVLEQALQAIEASDKRIAQLVCLRRQLASQFAQVAPDHEAGQILEERVAAVVSRLAQDNPGPLDTQQLVSLFETVIRLTEPLCGALSARNGAAKKG